MTDIQKIAVLKHYREAVIRAAVSGEESIKRLEEEQTERLITVLLGRKPLRPEVVWALRPWPWGT